MRVAVVRIVAGRVAMARMRFVSGESFLQVEALKYGEVDVRGVASRPSNTNETG